MLTFSLEGQVAVVSGGSRGIGAATVKLLAQAGAQVAFSYRANRRAAAEVIAQIPNGAERVLAVQLEAAHPRFGERLVASAVRRFGRLDVAVANAGIWNAEDLPLETMTLAQWDAMLDTNLRSIFTLSQAAVVQLKRQKKPARRPRGRIIIVASTAGQRGEAWHTHYGASKGGAIAFVRGLAPEVARAGILVNCVAPGWVATDMAAPAMREHPERIQQAIPLGRPGKPEEIAGCITFLCSPWAEFMTGSVLSANGGAVLA